MGSLTERMKLWWSGVDRAQRPIWIGGAALFLVLVIGAVVLAGRPQMSMLFGGLTPADQGMVVDELSKLGIKAEADTSGSVFVPSSKVAEARMRLATAKKLPNSGSSGMAVLDSISMTTSPSVEKEKLRAALEQDLANSIKTIAGVANARVHLTMGDNSPFVREQKPATASVVLTEETGGGIRPETAESIARLVQYGVTGLSADKIAISNDRGQMLFDGASSAAASGIADKRLQIEIEEARRRETDLQRKLDAAFGPGNTVVSIPLLKMNFDREKTFTLQRDPSKKPTVREAVKETMSDEERRSNSAAGADPNITANSGGESSDGRTYRGENTREEYVVNETERQIERATGDLQQMSINVLVNQAKIENPAPVQQYVAGYLGPLAEDQANFRTTVVATEFDSAAAQQQQQAQAAVASQNRTQQIMALLPIVALLVVGFMVLRALGKAAKSIAPAPMAASLPGGGTLAIEMPAHSPTPASDEDSRAFEVKPTLPEYVVQQMTPEQVIEFQQTGELAESLRNLAATMSSQKPLEIGAIPEKVHVPLEQLRHLSATKPQAVADLLKTWILDDRK